MHHLLVVEDDDGLARSIAACASPLGWLTTHAKAADEGLTALKNAAWQAVLCDLQLPGSSGLAVIAAAAKLEPRPHIIAMTGMADAAFFLEVARRAGATAILPKPFTADELATALATS